MSKPLGIAKFMRRRTFHTDPGGEFVELRVYDGHENLHIDGEYAIYRRTAVVTEHGELEAIVRDLAAAAVVYSITDGPDVCGVCDANDDHAFNCPWVRAVEWVSAHPVSGDQQ